MVRFPLFFFLLLSSSAKGGAGTPTHRRATAEVPRGGSPTPTPLPYLRLPVFVGSRLPLLEKRHLSPSAGTGKEPLPESVRELLLPGRAGAGAGAAAPPTASALSVATSCKPKRMRVQVPRSFLAAGGPDAELQLGTCRASKSTRDYIYFEYELHLCGTKRKMVDNLVTYSNTLRYDPPKLQGPIRRAAPFTLPIACHYNRYQYSYKIGYTPKMQLRKIFKPMRSRAKFALTLRNAQWERTTPSEQYVLGKPVYFQAEGPSTSEDKRLYVHSCYVTPGKSHAYAPRFPVVKNFGCMVESRDGRSRFLTHGNDAVRFSVDAFLFRGMKEQQMYMHCTMSEGSSVPTPTAKSCNYDRAAGRWVELRGLDSVCACCDSNCSSAAPTATKMISSKPWTVEFKAKPTTTPKRKMVTTTAVTTTTKTRPTTTARPTTPAPKPTGAVTARTATPPRTEVPSETIVGKVVEAVTEHQWPFGGGGAKWVEVEFEGRPVKGSAVVAAEDEKVEELVTEPRRTFEDIFDFDK